MVARMKAWLPVWIAMTALSFAADDLPPVEKAIPAAVLALPEPAEIDIQGGLKMAVSAATEKAQSHALQGLNHLHGGWEFEASRHFAVALKEDPECLLAHWGMVMCLISPSPETDEARLAASERMLDLVNQGKGSELERGYAFGLVKYIQSGPTEAAAAFRKVADRFPNDLQAAVFSAIFNRSGYDDIGEPTPDQLTSEKQLRELAAKFPDSPVPLHAFLLIHAEAPDLNDGLEDARRLVQMVPNYPPYFHILGHYEWRCGNHGKAASAFGRACTLYENWREENKVTMADSADWIKSECYRVVALSSKGDFETAYAAARRVSEIPLPEGRLGSSGSRMLLWEAKTLPARLLMKRGLKGNTQEALHSLPTGEQLKPTTPHSLAFWWIDALRLTLEAKRQAENGDLASAKITAAALAKHGDGLSRLQPAAGKGGELSAWNRSFRATEVLASELNGRIALAGPPEAHGSAYNWYRSASDRQRPATLIFPPAILGPMTARVGDYFLFMKRPGDAIEAYEEALKQFPNDLDTLNSLVDAYDAAKMPDKANAMRLLISSLL
jgi:tetratricopeptide (TPR) repeat protein